MQKPPHSSTDKKMDYWKEEEVLKDEEENRASQIEGLRDPYGQAMENDWKDMKQYYKKRNTINEGDEKGNGSAVSNKSKKYLYNYTPLLIATITGIAPIVKEILEQHPQAAEHDRNKEQNILHLAIKHRRKEILKIIKSKATIKYRLNARIDHKGNSILHQAADRSYYSVATSQKLIGPAMQLQEELR
ncbi:hypothetical protein ACE6H2_012911 [Prunus campanulata]